MRLRPVECRRFKIGFIVVVRPGLLRRPMVDMQIVLSPLRYDYTTQPTIHQNRGRSNIPTRLGAAQPGNRLRDVKRRAHAFHRHTCGAALDGALVVAVVVFVGETGDERGVDQAGDNDVDADGVRGVADAHGAGEVDEGGFGGGVADVGAGHVAVDDLLVGTMW